MSPNIRNVLFGIVFGLVFAPYIRAQQVSDRDVQERYLRLQSLEHAAGLTGKAKAESILVAYEKDFSELQNEKSLHKLDSSDLKLVFGAAYMTTFYTYRDSALHDLRKDMQELEAREIATHSEEQEMFRALVQQRNFDQARQFSAIHPNVSTDPIPEIRDESDSTRPDHKVLVVGQHSDDLVLRNVNLNPKIQIVVVGHPLCHFTQNAERDFESDPKLFAILKQHSVWIAPQDGELHTSDFQKWNEKHPAFPLLIVWKEDGWPKIDLWDTPTFYFFENGLLMDKVVGWPKGGNRAALISALKKVGLLQ